jgi:hypothetical protein
MTTAGEPIKPRAQSKAIQEFLEYCHTRSYPAKTAIIHATTSSWPT